MALARPRARVSAESHESPAALSRREWLILLPPAAVVLAGAHALAFDDARSVAAGGGAGEAPPVHPDFPRQHPDLVRSVVGASHANIDRVRELVTAHPTLAKAAWDWGFGDWETALGAASHTGRADIATLLIEHGARPNLFTLAMFGHLDAVRAVVQAMPGIQRISGPHGITLLQHARNAISQTRNTDEHRAKAREVEEYLESLGDADVGPGRRAASEAEKQLYLGLYTFGPGPGDAFDVHVHSSGILAIRRAGGEARLMHVVEEHAFAPVGAPAVRIRFKIADKRAVALTIHDPNPVLTAMRKGD